MGDKQAEKQKALNEAAARDAAETRTAEVAADLEAEGDHPVAWLHQAHLVDEKRNLWGWFCKAEETNSADETSFVMSTSDEDRMGDIVLQSWRLASFRSNPVILFNHNPHRGVIGRGLTTGKNRVRIGDRPGGKDGEKALLGTVKWDRGDHNPLGTMVAEQFKSGMMSAGSVGFIPHKRTRRSQLDTDNPHKTEGGFGQTLEHNELLEFSGVPIPANSKALAEREAVGEQIARGMPSDEVLKAALDQYLPAKIKAAILDAMRHDPEVRAVLEAYLLSLTIDSAESGQVPQNGSGEKSWFEELSSDS